jgi:succinoglycan biosynthesis protein ExoV
MNYIYYKSDIGNFGDDLNEWLWPQIFDGIDQCNNIYFIGIGSILDENIGKDYNLQYNKKKIVFGTGVRPSLQFDASSFDSTWDIKFLRGPLSSQVLGNKYEYITDAAYALRQLNSFEQLRNTEKKYEFSLMPYFMSLPYLNWEAICEELGYHYISPCSESGIEFTLREIAASKRLITEAMHGAIAADILRVPWSKFVFSTYDTENAHISNFKWNDWLFSIGLKYIDTVYIPLYTKNRLSTCLRTLSFHKVSVEFFHKDMVTKLFFEGFQNIIRRFSLSKDSVIKDIDSKIFEQTEKLKASLSNIHIGRV